MKFQKTMSKTNTFLFLLIVGCNVCFGLDIVRPSRTDKKKTFKSPETVQSNPGNVITNPGNVITKPGLWNLRNETTKTPTYEDTDPFFKEIFKYPIYENPCKTQKRICGSPLILTPYIESGNIQKAMETAEVNKHPGLSSTKSFSGFLTVNTTTNANMFFWFFPAMTHSDRVPLVIWLQGGPGESALFEIFNGFGPFRINKQLNVTNNPHTLIKTVNVLYLDNPIGTGFSFTDKKDGYQTSSEAVAKQLHEALTQFFAVFKNFRQHRVYITGEGYAAKFAVALTKIYHRSNKQLMNLKGIILGNPYLAPDVLFDYGNYIFDMGYIFLDEVYKVNEHLDEARRNAQKRSYAEALAHIHHVIESPYRVPINRTSYIPEMTNISSQYNILETKDDKSLDYYISLINSTSVRQAIHVGHLPFQDGRMAYTSLINDLLCEVDKDGLSVVLDNYRVLIYNGIFDKKIPYILSVDIFGKVRGHYYEEYRNATRKPWTLNENSHTIAGYVKEHRKITNVAIRDSGHLVAKDQPEVASVMMNSFIFNKPFEIFKL